MSETSSLPSWRAIQKENFVYLKPLLDFLELSLKQREEIAVQSNFTLNLPRRLAEKIKKGSLDDPILKQFVPLKLEHEINSKFILDPVQDNLFRPETRLLQKYKGRALLLTTSACAMHCRYCFRQNLDYGDVENFSKELYFIKNDSSLHEVFLSGGEPLSLSDQKLNYLLNEIEEFSHITKIRFHTRFPIGIPERIDDSFLKLLKDRRLKFYFVFHINHPKELDKEILYKISLLQNLGALTLNQAVLLKGINDSFETQLELHKVFIDAGILPYYLHQLDRVRGTSHFEVDQGKGHKIMEYLRANLPGYGVPTYVQEIPQKPNKTPLLNLFPLKTS